MGTVSCDVLGAEERLLAKKVWSSLPFAVKKATIKRTSHEFVFAVPLTNHALPHCS